MRILHLVQGYQPAIGGTEFLIQNVSEKLVKLFNDDVTVFTTNAYNCEGFNTPSASLMPPEETVINGVKVKRFPVFKKLSSVLNLAQRTAYRLRLPLNDRLRALYSGPIVFSMVPKITKFKCDVMAASSFPLLHMHYAGSAKRFNKKPLVLIGGLHTDDDWGFNRSIIFKAIRRADAYIAYTTHEKDFLVNKGIESARIHVIGTGVDFEQFENVNPTTFRKKHNLGDNPVVSFIGQQGGHKGIDTLLHAMPLVWKKFPHTRLVIAGARTNFSAQLEKIIEGFDKEQKKNIILIDNFEEQEKAEIMAACDVFASPSGHESFGITFLEAWASKKPVIGCRAGAIPTVIEEGKDGILVTYKDINELASVIIELLYDKKLRLRLGENGKQKVLERYTWTEIAKKFRSVYEKVASSE